MYVLRSKMMKLPAHKNMIDPPGQIVYKDYAELEVRTLGQYLGRKYPEDKPDPKKLTFDEWWKKEHPFVDNGYNHYIDWIEQRSWAEKGWKAAKENK